MTQPDLRRELARTEDQGGIFSCAITLRPDGSIRVDRFDHGPTPERLLGGDHEHWIDIPTESMPKLAFFLLTEMFQGEIGAVSGVSALCAAAEVEAKETLWR